MDIASPRRGSSNLKSLSPEKSAQAFMTQLQDSRQAFDLFKEQAEKKGLGPKKPPLLHSQAHYYRRYIKNRNLPAESKRSFALPGSLNRTSGETLPEQPIGSHTARNSRNRFTKSIDFPQSCAHRKPFVPLKDLLTRNHDDRVREYLDKMKGLSIDEIVNTQILNKEKVAQSNDGALRNSRLSPDQEGMPSNDNSPHRESNRNNRSNLSMGMTHKQMNMMDRTMTQVQTMANAATQ